MDTEIAQKIERALYYMQNDTLKAIELFDEILETEPDNIDALNGKGSSLMKLNMTNEAEKYFDYSLSVSPNSSAFINKGNICKSRKEYHQALFYYDKANQINPNLNNIIKILKNEILEHTDSESIIDLSCFNHEANEMIKKGLEYKGMNKLWDAFDCFQKAIENDETCRLPLKPIINEMKLVLQHELLIKTPIMEKSRIDNLKIKSSELMLIENDLESALTIVNVILENDENDLDALNQKGCILFLFDRCGEAIECFNKCLNIDEHYHYALFNKAIVLRRQKKLEESLDCFDELLKVSKNYDKVKPYQLEILDTLHEIDLQ